MSTSADVGLLVAVTIFCLIPFIAKPIHIDDPLFLWTAKQIHQHPLDFYGFSVNWYGYDYGMDKVNQNPPLAAYYIALVAYFTGFRETALHLAFVVPNVALIIGIYFVARHFCSHPLIAALATLLTPACLVSSTTLMCDTMMLTFWCWAVVCWLQGLATDRLGFFFASGVLIALAALTKYFGLSLIPLLGAYTLLKQRRWGFWLLALLLPALVLAAFDYFTRWQYGHGLLWGAAGYVAREGGKFHMHPLSQTLLGFVFLGGCLVTIGFFAPLTWPRWTLIAGGVASVCGFLLLTTRTEFLGARTEGNDFNRFAFTFQVVLFLAATAHIIGLCALDLRRRPSADSLFLVLWAAGTFVFATYFNWTINARTILPLVPAVAILLVRRLEQQRPEQLDQRPLTIAWPLFPAFALSMVVGWADYSFALSARTAARTLAANFGAKPPLWFQGHWGFQYYMEEEGAEAFGSGSERLTPGEVIIVPLANTNILGLPAQAVELVDNYVFDASGWVTTFSVPLWTCFYVGQQGVPLPFAFGKVPPDIYQVFQVQRSINLVPPQRKARQTTSKSHRLATRARGTSPSPHRPPGL